MRMSVLAAGRGACGAMDFFARRAGVRDDLGVGIDGAAADEIGLKCSDFPTNTVHISSSV